jgi:hypothetical protein
LFRSSTQYWTGRASPLANDPGSASVKLPGLPGATLKSVPTGLHVPVLSRLQIRTAKSAFNAVLSVLRFGIVHVKATRLPVRIAVKSVTGAGRFSDGGCGAPGVPHPESNAHNTTASAAQVFRSNELIAFSLMEQDKLHAGYQIS